MKLLPTQTDEASLSAFGEEALALLIQRDYLGLANRFGYALAYGLSPSDAIEADFMSAVASPLPLTLGAYMPIVVKYFSPNETGLFAVVECSIPLTDGTAVLLELIVAGSEGEKHITLEGISGVIS